MESLRNLRKKPFRRRASEVLTPGNEAGSGPQDAGGDRGGPTSSTSEAERPAFHGEAAHNPPALEGAPKSSTASTSYAESPISHGGAADEARVRKEQPEKSTPSGQEALLPFDVSGVTDIDGLKNLLEHIQTIIEQHEKHDTADITSVGVVKVNLEPSANFLGRLANVCFPAGGLTRDIAVESHSALAKTLKGAGNLHWIGAVFLILGSIVSRIDQMKQNKKDCLKFLGKLSSLGDHLVKLSINSHEVDNEEEKTQIDKRIKDGCSFVVAGVLLCFKHLKSRSWKRGLLVDTYKKEMEGLQSGINAEFFDLHLFETEQILRGVISSQKTLQEVHKKIDKIERTPQFYVDKPDYPQKKVGLEEKVNDVLELLRITDVMTANTRGVGAEVQGVLLHGMGGLGKSTLAEAVCANISKREPFSTGSFAKVELGPNASDNISAHQQRIHRNLPSSEMVREIQDSRQGQKILEHQFRNSSIPILLLIDNIYKTQDLEDLFPSPLCLPPQSRVVMTSRVVDAAGTLDSMSISCDQYEVPGLDKDQAVEVLQLHLPQPLQINQTVDRVIKKCAGLPLLLEVIGKHVRWKSRDDVGAVSTAASRHARSRSSDRKGSVWDTVIKRLDEGQSLYPTGTKDERVDRIFSLGYDQFEKGTQQLFLDICLLRGHDVDWVRALDQGQEIDLLEDFSLVKQISDESSQENLYIEWNSNEFGFPVTTLAPIAEVYLHDLGATFGLHRAEGTRLILEGGQIVQDKCRDPELVEGLYYRSYTSAETLDLVHKSLRILVVRGRVCGSCDEIPSRLQICSIDGGFPYKDVQRLQSLRVLEINQSSGETLEAAQLPEQLQIFKLNAVRGFKTFHEDAFKKCWRSLHTMHILSCYDFEEFPVSVCKLNQLVVFVVGENPHFKSLPEKGFERLEALQRVHLCQHLQDLPEGFSELQNLRELFIQGLERVSFSFSKLTSLEYLCLSSRKNLEYRLPEAFGRAFGSLNFALTQEKGLFGGFGKLHQLRVLHIRDAEGLEKIEAGDFSKFKFCKKIVFERTPSLRKLPEGFVDLPVLEELNLDGCAHLSELPADFFGLRALKRLDLSGCCSLKYLPQRFGELRALRFLNLDGCTRLETLPRDFGLLLALENLRLGKCVKLQQLPDSSSRLTSLSKLDLRHCAHLEKLPHGFGGLSALSYLDLRECTRLQQLPEDFSHLARLRRLDLSRCRRIKELPKDFERLVDLKELNLSGCESLQQDSISQLRSHRATNPKWCTCAREEGITWPDEWQHECDGCDARIIGRLWHCKVCYDFDLCDLCYNTKASDDLPWCHKEDHDMISYLPADEFVAEHLLDEDSEDSDYSSSDDDSDCSSPHDDSD